MKRSLYTYLLGWWMLGLAPVFVIFCMSFGWDRSFGYPPYGVWAFTGLYLLAGTPLVRRLWRDSAKTSNVDG